MPFVICINWLIDCVQMMELLVANSVLGGRIQHCVFVLDIAGAFGELFERD